MGKDLSISQKVTQIKKALNIPVKEMKIGEMIMIFFQIGGEPYYIKVT